jgi:hypothetical protein
VGSCCCSSGVDPRGFYPSCCHSACNFQRRLTHWVGPKTFRSAFAPTHEGYLNLPAHRQSQGCPASAWPWQLLGLLDRRATPFARFSWSFNFRLFQQYRSITAIRPCQCRVYFFPDSGRWFSDCADPNCYAYRILWNIPVD